MATLVRHPVAVVLVREDDLRARQEKEKAAWSNNTHTRRQGIEAHGVVVLGQDRLYVRRERCEVTLVEDRLDELAGREAI